MLVKESYELANILYKEQADKIYKREEAGIK